MFRCHVGFLCASVVACDLSEVQVDVAFEMHTIAFSPKSAAFTELMPPGTGRNLFSVLPTAGGIVVMGGIDDTGTYVGGVERYDRAKNTWSSRASWSNPGAAWILPVGGRICAIGGYQDLQTPIRQDVDCYDPMVDRWTRGSSLPGRYTSIHPAVVGGEIFLVGGTEVSGKNVVLPVASARAYNPETDTWRDLAPLPAARGLMGVVPVGMALYVVGGYGAANFDSDQDTPEETEMLVYDVTGDSWGTAPQMPSARTLFGTDEVGGELVVFLGLTDAPLVEHYNPATQKWSASPEPSDDFSGGVFSYVKHAAQMYFLVLADSADAGGSNSSGKLWVHDIGSGDWSVPAMHDPDGRDALFVGTSVDSEIIWTGALTAVDIQGRRATLVEASVERARRHGAALGRVQHREALRPW